MNSHEARRLLEMLRPNGADDADPRFAEALRQAERDPELGRWLEEQRRFDSGLARSLQYVTAPGDLRRTILGGHHPRTLRFRREWWVPTAVAASFLLLAAAAGTLVAHRTVQFPELRAQLVNEAWNGEAHLDYKSSDLTEIQRWLARQGLDSDFVLPTAFREMHLHGCQVLKAENCRVPMLCLADGVKHLHLFVVSGDQIAGLPPQGVPDFQKCGAWKTAAWREGSTTYILSGLKTQAFVSKFRRSGRWTFSG